MTPAALPVQRRRPHRAPQHAVHALHAVHAAPAGHPQHAVHAVHAVRELPAPAAPLRYASSGIRPARPGREAS
ncbi:hypothetical protein [Streptomyces anulatus]|uniref:hypothetical protein n=1 Tax=Streptomyces anulatus TaxID=1892 RepID=UPI00255C368B|nr:hypothetical protein [Streptomyces anulatus]WIY79516.1 hypothetical protein QPM16_30375 [Streptomyces anulatus]